jgi:hypothetical protein
MTREEMLRSLQDDIDAWPQSVKDAGVKNAAGSAFRPVARNNEILRTPEDPEVTYAYMIAAWEADGAESGSNGWARIIEQVGPEYTWEYLMADPDKPYAELFEGVRERVQAALEDHESTAIWVEKVRVNQEADDAQNERIRRIQDEMRSGKRSRLRM